MLQHDFLSHLATRLVAPLEPEGRLKRVERLHPVIDVEGRNHLLVTDRSAAVAVSALGPAIASAREHREAIVAASTSC